MQFKHLIWNLNKPEIDLANILINIVERYEQFDIGHAFDYATPFYTMDVNLHDLSSSMGYLGLDDKVIQEITTILDNLSRTPAAIYYREKNDRYIENTSFLLAFTTSSIKRDLNKRLTLTLATSLVKVLRENKGIFHQLYTYDRYDLRGKYSVILYDELARKTKGSNTQATTYKLEDFIELVDFELTPTTNIESWTKINSNILSRAAKEITEKTNMYFQYDKVKEKIADTNRMQTVGVRFETSLAPELEATCEYFTDEYLTERKIAYYMEKEINRKVRELKKFGTLKSEDEENYRYSQRKDLVKQKDEYVAQASLQEWVNWVKYGQPGEHGLVALLNYGNHSFVTVNSDYKLVDVETGEILSTSARDTKVKIQKFLDSKGDFGLVDADYKKSYSISYSKG